MLAIGVEMLGIEVEMLGIEGRNEANQGENLRMGVELTNQNCAEG